MQKSIDLSTLFWLPPPPATFSQEIVEVQQLKGPAKQLRRLASARLNSSQLRQLKFTIDKLDNAENRSELLSEYRRIRIGMVGMGTLDFLTDLLPGSGLRHSLLIEAVKGRYDSLSGFAFGGDGGLHGKLDAIVVMLDLKVLGFPDELLNSESHEQALCAATQIIEKLVDGLVDQFSCPVILSTIVVDPSEMISSTESYVYGSHKRFIGDLNDAVVRLAETGKCRLWDLDQIASSIGRWRWCDPISKHVAKSPFAISLAPFVADGLCATLAGVFGKARRALILDLDNTVWGGVIGDDGLANINIGQGDAVGEAHLAVQRFALELRRRGIILAVCSKNEDYIAREPFRAHPDMLLREQHIAVFQANWQDKATNIATIAKTLNLGLDAFVFLDDNPAERARVREELPEVAIPDLPDDPAWFVAYLSSAGYFEIPSLNSEDLHRAKTYQDNAQRAEILSKVGNFDEYLVSLEMVLAIANFDDVGRSRITQLIGKSNQFNLTTRRYQEADIRGIENDPNAVGLQFRLADRFGDNGMICVVILKRFANSMYIDTWLMSCRVLERRVEQAVLNEIVLRAKALGLEKIVGQYIPTKRNEMVRDHYSKLGFKSIERPDFGLTTEAPAGELWELDTQSFDLAAVPLKIVRTQKLNSDVDGPVLAPDFRSISI